jgi:penicillin-binding protein 1A
MDVGPENFVEMANDLGVEAPLDGYPAEAIGGLTIGVSPLDMATAYATFSSGGVHHDATAIDRVEFPNGDVDEPDEEPGNRVLTEGEAYVLTDVLTGVVESGTGTAANYCGSGALAGKTGTTDNNTDAWFVGFSKNLATAVWTGDPDVNTSMGSSAFGGTYSAPTWNAYMSVADPSCEPFEAPDELPNLSSYYGEHAESGPQQYDDTSTSPTPTTTTPTDDDGGGGGGGGGNGAYAPGIQDGGDPADDGKN